MTADQPQEKGTASLADMEQDLISAILQSRDDEKRNVTEIKIPRIRVRGEPLSFRVRPLHDSERRWCERQATRVNRDKRFANLPMSEERDDSQYNSVLIHTATVDEDRAALWDNKTLWQAYRVGRGRDLVEAILLAGEKLTVVGTIFEISGFIDTSEESVEDLSVKSSS
jgi:hypothetical protein